MNALAESNLNIIESMYVDFITFFNVLFSFLMVSMKRFNEFGTIQGKVEEN